MRALKAKWSELCVGGFFVGLFLVGTFLYQDFGVSWDELSMMEMGVSLWAILLEGDPAYYSSIERYYGPVMAWVWGAVAVFAGFDSSQLLYGFCHYLVFWVYFSGGVSIYCFIKRQFSSWQWGLVGASLFVLMPRLFGHGFYNLKDIPFLVFFMWGIFTGIELIQSPSWKKMFLFGLCVALAVDTRILGGLVYLIIALVGFVVRRRYFFKYIVSAGVIAAFLSILFWPFLWIDPIGGMFEVVQRMAHYPWEGQILFNGSFISSMNLPWYYALEWIFITTPLVTLLCFFLGVIAVLWTRKVNWVDGVMLLWLVLPFVLVIGLKSVLYDGWRHLFFIFPAMLWFALRGIQWVSGFMAYKKMFLGFIALGYLGVLVEMVQLHPYQAVYFNRLVQSPVREKFEMDYWGLSMRECLELVLAYDNSKEVAIFSPTWPGFYNTLLLSLYQQKRVVMTNNPKKASYMITHFRWHPEDYDLPVLYEIKRQGEVIAAVYRLD